MVASRLTLLALMLGVAAVSAACRESSADVADRLGDHELFSVRADGEVLAAGCHSRTVFTNAGCRRLVADAGSFDEIVGQFEAYFRERGWETICKCGSSPPFELALSMRSETERISVSLQPASSYSGELPPGTTYVLTLLASERR